MLSTDQPQAGPSPPDWRRHNPVLPIVVSIIAFIAWLVFILAYALAWSNNYSLFQNIIVTVASLLIVGLVVGLGWILWGLRQADRFWTRW
jgi:hypothetical protein